MNKKKKLTTGEKILQDEKDKPRKKKTVLVNTESSPDTGNATRPAAGFPIVGIGASAGGLAAFEAFFSGMPADTDPRHGLSHRLAPTAGTVFAPRAAHAH